MNLLLTRAQAARAAARMNLESPYPVEYLF